MAATLVNLHRRRGSKRAKPQDFFRRAEARLVQSPEEMKNALVAWADQHNRTLAKAKTPKLLKA